MADEIFAIDAGGCTGQSTRSGIGYSEAAGKLVTYLKPVCGL